MNDPGIKQLYKQNPVILETDAGKVTLRQAMSSLNQSRRQAVQHYQRAKSAGDRAGVLTAKMGWMETLVQKRSLQSQILGSLAQQTQGKRSSGYARAARGFEQQAIRYQSWLERAQSRAGQAQGSHASAGGAAASPAPATGLSPEQYYALGRTQRTQGRQLMGGGLRAVFRESLGYRMQALGAFVRGDRQQSSAFATTARQTARGGRQAFGQGLLSWIKGLDNAFKGWDQALDRRFLGWGRQPQASQAPEMGY